MQTPSASLYCPYCHHEHPLPADELVPERCASCGAVTFQICGRVTITKLPDLPVHSLERGDRKVVMNDPSPVAFQSHPDLARYIDILREQPTPATLWSVYSALRDIINSFTEADWAALSEVYEARYLELTNRPAR